ncbi:bifunctional hydroxymethylpyrimidine kinase/phosphomethylpyrimidine kinase [Flavobacterium sp. SM2513]|uniref:bifunctional hydroxymethylpyrimidine kinase/phosphomethylpyrimidine kinase n=1 Tax=Flavobacterium sp. SM2513 TaxID=3424766 RepID=UPI003D7F3C37
MKKYHYSHALTIAGFDGSGGAGIQADIKTFSALGCYATSVLTALPIQNTLGVQSIYPIPELVVQNQLNCILSDIFPDAIKIGMVHNSALVTTIAATLASYKKCPVVFDPVMVATSGDALITEETIKTIIEQLFPLSDIITPNLDEAAILSGIAIASVEDMYKAGALIHKLGAKNILLKGGHLKTPTLTSLLFLEDGSVKEYHFEKYDTNNTHGSGCTLSSAIASYLAQGQSLETAVAQGQNYVQEAIYQGMDVAIGKGNGPLNHFYNPQKLLKNELEY